MYLLFSDELDNGHSDALLTVDVKEKLGIFNEVSFYRQPLLKTFPVNTSTT
jgi:hypothetical protein